MAGDACWQIDLTDSVSSSSHSPVRELFEIGVISEASESREYPYPFEVQVTRMNKNPKQMRISVLSRDDERFYWESQQYDECLPVISDIKVMI
ncbi:uncharacterized protein PHALS_14148 [Plasmopara halstedii]|uniref:Uncharacterized protein n=1 Tax=Plasmopara halstedii TaxID=4781 RepID=A0A0P1ASS8_PLAHL|nr:uncharacterized protein PHALS_14148 [Plasmopara halstedii]CEG43860.1 hypothetical protein PHALS_14148 [Plasmopara halstedii]|eukprot:XP_024580229.1 hypothetical protein PHALS_14148 [Plasmopara halstedii]